jgi:hypothetical protein
MTGGEAVLKAYAYNDKHEYLYEPLGQAVPRKLQGIKHSDPRRFTQVLLNVGSAHRP